MKVLVPNNIAEHQLLSSVVPETDHPFWSPSATYGAGAVVMHAHRNFESLQSANVGHVPTLVSTDEWWLDLGPTNRWAMFDSMVSSATSFVTSGATPQLRVTLAPGLCNGVAVLDVSGAASVTVRQINAGATVFEMTQVLDDTYIDDWYSYWFSPFQTKSDVLFGPLPPYPTGQIEIVVTPNVVGDTVSVGAVHFGNTVKIGETQFGARVGIISYSRIKTDDFGVSTLVRRKHAKKNNFELVIQNNELRRVYSTLAALDATPAVWIGADHPKFGVLVVYGFVKDFNLNVMYAKRSTASLEITGMI